MDMNGDLSALDGMIERIKATGIDADTAEDYAIRIGDRPCLDDAGHVLVMDGDGKVVATLPESVLGREV